MWRMEKGEAEKGERGVNAEREREDKRIPNPQTGLL